MRILFDHGTPAPLRKGLGDHSVDLARERGWDTIQNGELLDKAEAEGYDVLVTTDKSLPYQQNLDRRMLTIVVVRPRWTLVQKQFDEIRSAIEVSQPGSYIVISENEQQAVETQIPRTDSLKPG